MNPNEKAVTEVVEKYADATFRGDVDTLRTLFHPEASMQGYLADDLIVGGPEPFFEDLASMPSLESSNAPYKATIQSVWLGRNVACVQLLETGFGPFTIEDSLQLIHVNQEWLIISKLFASK